MRLGRVSLAAFVVVGALVHTGVFAAAQETPITDGPTIVLDRSSMRPGDRVLLTLDGFDGTAVTIAVCGNQARRGSVDCNITASEGLGLDRDGSSTLAEFPVAAPPTPCPCLIRASTTSFDEVAVVPIELLGHPVGPVVGASPSAPPTVAVTARRAAHGLVARARAALGGPTAYDVTVTVRNGSSETLRGLELAGSAGRSRHDDLTALELSLPGPLEPGQTWTQVVKARLPAPVVGTFHWEVTASGAGPSVHAEAVTRSLPLALVLLLVVFVVDVGAIVWRRAVGRSRGGPAPVPAT